MEATFKFTYVEKYPDEPPLWEIHSQENLEDSDIEDILTLLQEQVCLSELNVISLIYIGPDPLSIACLWACDLYRIC